jgi:hypothetical protein
MNNFISWQLVSTLNSGPHQAMIQEYECIQKLNNISWRSPRFKLRYIENICKVYKGKLNYKQAQGRLKIIVFKNTKYNIFHRVNVMYWL